MSNSDERCEDCAKSRAADMPNWLHCSEKPAYIYLSAPLAACTFDPSRFVPKVEKGKNA